MVFLHTYDHLCILCLEGTFFSFLFKSITFEIVYTYISINNPTAYEVLDESQIFYIWQQYLFLHTYDT